MIKAIFFDIDGTLIDHKTSQYCALTDFVNERFNDLITDFESFVLKWKELGKYYFDEYADGRVTIIEQRIRRMQDIMKIYGMELEDEEALCYFNHYLKIYRKYWRLYPDVKPALRTLKDYTLGVISNGDSKGQREKLSDTGIYDLFSVVLISEDIKVSKPSCQIYERAVDEAGVSASETAYVGDDIKADILGAKNAGMMDIYINRYDDGFDGASMTLTSLLELKGKLKESEGLQH